MIHKILHTSLIASLFLATSLPIGAMAQVYGGGNTGSNMQGTKKTETHERMKEKRVTRGKSVKEAKKIDVSCIQTAIETRDSAIITALDTFSSSLKTALQTRKEALKTAWGETSIVKRREAIRKAWNDFKKSSQAAEKAWNISRHAAWNTFMKDRKACGKGVMKDDAGTEAIDLHVRR